MVFHTSWQMKHRQVFFQPLVAPGALVFDIGANIGEFTAAFLSLGAGRVVAVEPQPELCRHIAASFPAALADGRLAIRSCAVSAAPGRMRLHVASDPGHSMSTLSPEFLAMSLRNGHVWDEAAAIDVDVVTLAQLIAEFGTPDYLKIDVEGHDLAVLQGLDRPVQLMSFEFNTDAGLIGLADACIAHVAALGDYEFNFQAEAPGMVELQLEPWVDAEVMTYILRNDVSRSPVYGDVFCRLRG